MDLSFDLSDLGWLCSNRIATPRQWAISKRPGVTTRSRRGRSARLARAGKCGPAAWTPARAYELASQLDRAIETSREAASTMVAARRHDPANKDHLKDAGLTFYGSVSYAGASSRPQGRPGRGGLALRADRIREGRGDAEWTRWRREPHRRGPAAESGSMTAASEDCRRRLLRGHGGRSTRNSRCAPPHQHQFTLR